METLDIAIRGLVEDLIKEYFGCSSECNVMLLGAVVKAFHGLHLSQGMQSGSYLGSSVAVTLECFRKMRRPINCPVRSGAYTYYHGSDRICDLASYVDPITEDVENRLKGLELRDYLPSEDVDQAILLGSLRFL